MGIGCLWKNNYYYDNIIVVVYYKDMAVWCTQKAMGMLFDFSTDENIGLHLKYLANGELEKDSVTEKISVVRQEYDCCVLMRKQGGISPLYNKSNA